MEKIKKSMRREDGFTLVELLAVIVILGIILAIAIPAIGGVITKAQGDADAAEKDLVVDAGRLWFTTKENKDATWVDVSTLITDGYYEVKAGKTALTGGVHKKIAGASDTNPGAITYEYLASAPAAPTP